MDRAYTIWTDVYGATRLTWYSYASGLPSLSFFLALGGLANPFIAQAVAGTVQIGSGPASSNPYPNVSDSALLTFSTALGTQIGVVVPGFKESLYLSDNQTVDPAQPLVLAFVAFAVGFLVDSAGNPATAFIGGLRQKRGY
jgi:hypothetical protein